jgi:hypothetical protein
LAALLTLLCSAPAQNSFDIPSTIPQKGVLSRVLAEANSRLSMQRAIGGPELELVVLPWAASAIIVAMPSFSIMMPCASIVAAVQRGGPEKRRSILSRARLLEF